MIQLIVEDYCQDCTDFEPVANIQPMYGNNTLVAVQTEVTCRARRKCQRLMTHLMQGSEEKEREAYARGVADEEKNHILGGE